MLILSNSIITTGEILQILSEQLEASMSLAPLLKTYKARALLKIEECPKGLNIRRQADIRLIRNRVQKTIDR